MLGSNLSAAPVAGIAGSALRSRTIRICNPGTKAIKSQGSGDRVPVFQG